MDEPCLQERHAPNNACFGCGPANPKGLHVRSFEKPGEPGVLVATWRAEPHHEAFPGVLNGGITGALLDCHSNWTALLHLMRKAGESKPPCTVTASFKVDLLAPTPTSGPITLEARVRESRSRSAVVDATLSAGGAVTAKCEGTFVWVKPDHPAYHRW